MSWTLTRLVPDVTAKLEIWRELAARTSPHHPMLDADYLGLVIDHMAPGRSLYWLQYAVAGHAECVGILERHGRGQWSSWHLPQLPVVPIVGAPAVATGAAAGLFAALPGLAWRFKLHDVDPAYVSLPAALSGLAQSTIALHQTVTIRFDSGDYWAARPRELQRNMARSLRKLKALAGEPRLLRLEAREQMAAVIGDHARLEQSGWKGRNGSAMHTDDPLGRFYRAVLECYTASGNTRVYQLYAGDTLLASQLCIIARRVLVTMKTACHGAHLNCSPGRVLDHLMLRELQTDPQVRTCEFCVHAGKLEQQWASEVRTLAQVEIYRGAALRNVVAGVRKLWRRVKARRPVEAATA